LNPERWAQIEDLFHRAAECDPQQRASLLDGACNGDEELRRAVEALLASEERAREDMQAAVHKGLDDATFPLVGETVSHYRILAGLGGGGMGLVYRAEDIKLGRYVALKFLPEESAQNPEALGRFEREARSASALEHSNICPIYEFGEHDGQPFLVMQLLEGQTLRELISSGEHGKPPLEVPKLLDLARQITEGLEAAHRHGIIHRDIKPANIFVTTQGQAKILDFGVAKLTQGGWLDGHYCAQGEAQVAATHADMILSRTGMIAGTAAYMSPEQIRGEQLDVRTDIFSFGLVLYEVVTGVRAFTGSTWPVLRQAILTQTPRSARVLNPEVPPKLDEIIKKALEKNRQARYRTSSEMRAGLEDLQRQLASQHLPRRWAVAAGVVFTLFVAATVFLLKRPPKVVSVVPDVKLRQLTTNSAENPVLDGAISPDGKYLAFNDVKGMHIKLIETGETHAVPQPDALKGQNLRWEVGAWFPDSTRFLAQIHPAEEEWNQWSSRDTSIWVTSVLGGAPRKLRDNSVVYSVSPNGLLISFGTNKGKFGEREVWVMGPNGEEARKFDEAKEGSGICCLGWSHDGERYAYILTDDSGGTMLSRNIKGGPPATLFGPAEMEKMKDINWLLDGQVVYSLHESDAMGNTCNYWTMRLDLRTGRRLEQPRRLTNWAGFCMYGGSTTADGKRLAFLQAANHGTVYIADLLAGGTRITNLRHFTFDDSFNLPQGWTNDSKAVIFTSNRTGQFAIYKQSLNEDTPERISAEAGSKIMRIPLAGGSPEPLTTALASGVLCANPPSDVCVLSERSEDRKHMIFASIDPLRGRGAELARFDLDPNIEYFHFDVSPDGTQLAVAGDPQGPIYILPLHGGKAQVIQVRLNDMQQFFWASDGKGFYIADRTKRGAVLSYMNLHGNTHVLWETPGSPWIYARPSPDGRHLAIAASSNSTNVWVMENF
jgi:eukaryotic-like serine/threonine-protein kinase